MAERDEKGRTPPQREPAEREDAVYRKKLHKATFMYGLFALLVIPVYTLDYACNASLLKASMSMIGGEQGKLAGLIVWGVLSAVFFLSFTNYLFMLTRYRNLRVKRLMWVACGLLMAAVFIPFLPEVLPVLSKLHEIFAMTSCILIVITLFIFSYSLQKYDRRIYVRAMIYLTSAVLMSGVVIFLVGVTSLLEVLFTIAMCVFLFLMLVWLSRSKDIDVVKAVQEREEDRAARRCGPEPSEEGAK